MDDRLQRNRKPRVHIKYEVETDDAKVERELPFVVGVMGDFVGNAPRKPLPSLRERDFITVDRDNFDDVMRRLAPGVKLRVKNHLQDDDTELEVNLSFNSLRDFEPSELLKQVEPLRKLKQARDRLRDLQSCIDRSPELESLLQDALSDKERLLSLASQIDEHTRNHEGLNT